MDALTLARRTLLTELLFGVDAIPVRMTEGGVVDAVPDRGAPAAEGPPSVDASAAPDPARPSRRAGAAAPEDVAALGTPGMPATHGQRAPGDGGDHAARLAALRAEHDTECPHCTTATAHTQTVFGDGDPAARLMFIGEAPGETEDRVGRPFVGRAGEKLDQIIEAMGLRRADVYIANVLKSRPPDNRTPLPHEVEACGPYLHRQIAIVRPTVIVTLGGPATKLILGVEQGITRLRGTWAWYRGTDEEGGALEIPVMPTFHPAYLLRNYTPQTRAEVWSDMKQVMERLGGEERTARAFSEH